MNAVQRALEAIEAEAEKNSAAVLAAAGAIQAVEDWLNHAGPEQNRPGVVICPCRGECSFWAQCGYQPDYNWLMAAVNSGYGTFDLTETRPDGWSVGEVSTSNGCRFEAHIGPSVVLQREEVAA